MSITFLVVVSAISVAATIIFTGAFILNAFQPPLSYLVMACISAMIVFVVFNIIRKFGE